MAHSKLFWITDCNFWGKNGIVIIKKKFVIIKTIRDIIKLGMSNANTVILTPYVWLY